MAAASEGCSSAAGLSVRCTTARLAAYCGFGGDEEFAQQAVADSAWTNSRGGGGSRGAGAATSGAAVDAEDTNDDFCRSCGGGGDLLLCDRCGRSYHMYCLDPPLEKAPDDGEWHCPAHSTARRNVNKELSSLTREVDDTREKEMGYRQPRVDPVKYQAVVPRLLTASERPARSPPPDASTPLRDFDPPADSSWPLWLPRRMSALHLVELLAFGHWLTALDVLSPVKFNEQLMEHVHMCAYQTRIAKYTLLKAWKHVCALPDAERDGVHREGFRDGDLLMAVAAAAHVDRMVRLQQPVPLGAPRFEAPLPPPSRGVRWEDLLHIVKWEEVLINAEGAGMGVVRAQEAEWEAAFAGAVAAWEVEVAAAKAAGTLSLERLSELVRHGVRILKIDASILNVCTDAELDVPPDFETHAPGLLAAVVNVSRLAAQHRAAVGWSRRNAATLGSAVPIRQMREALAQAEAAVRSLPLTEVTSLRSRLAECEAWLAKAPAAQQGVADVRELQEMLRHADALRLQAPEMSALRTRVAACKRWMGRVHADLLRRTSSRGRPSAKMTEAEAAALLVEAAELKLRADETALVRARLAEAAGWKAAVAQALAATSGVDAGAMAHMARLLSKGEDELNLALDEIPVLEARVKANRRWVERAVVLQSGSATAAQLVAALGEGRRLGLAVPEMELLAECLKESHWVEQAEAALARPSDLSVLAALVQGAGSQPSSHVTDLASELTAKIEAGKVWATKLETALAERPSLREASILLSDIDSGRLLLPRLSELRAAVGKAKGWQEQARRAQAKQTRGASARPTLAELERLLSAGLELPLGVPELSLLAMQVREASQWMKRAQTLLESVASSAGDEITDEAAFAQREETEAEGNGAGSAGGNGSAAQELVPGSASAASGEVDDLLRRTDSLNVSVPFAPSLRVAQWRLRLRAARGGRRGSARLSDLQALIQDAHALGMRPPPPPQAVEAEGAAAGPSIEQGAGRGQGAGNGQGPPFNGQAGTPQPDRPPSRQAQRRSARTPSPTPPAAGSEASSASAAGSAVNLPLMLCVPEDEPTSPGLLAELERASRELGVLMRLVGRCEAWEAEADAMLAADTVHVENLEALLKRGEELPIATESREYLAATFADAQKWAAQARKLEAPDARLEDVQKLLKDFSKANLHSDSVANLRARADAGVEWLFKLKALYANCGVQLDTVAKVLESSGAELYCFCRQPDDLRRQMLACDVCETWYHISCVGVTPARAKAMTANDSQYECPSCAAARGAEYPFEVRCRAPPLKITPRTAPVETLLRQAAGLRVRVKELELLKKAFASCREWEMGAARRLRAALPAGLVPADFLPKSSSGLPLTSLPDDEFLLHLSREINSPTYAELAGRPPFWMTVSARLQEELYAEGEAFRVEPHVMSMLKAWKVRRQLHAAKGMPDPVEAGPAAARAAGPAAASTAAAAGAGGHPPATGPAAAAESAAAGPAGAVAFDSLLASEPSLECTDTKVGMHSEQADAAGSPPSAASTVHAHAAANLKAAAAPPAAPAPVVDVARLRSVLETAVAERLVDQSDKNPVRTFLDEGLSQLEGSMCSQSLLLLCSHEVGSMAQDVLSARALVRDAEGWTAEAASMAKSACAVDPSAMAALVHKARAASVKLPVLASLEERAAKVGRWAELVEGAIAKAEASGARAEPAGGPSLEDLLRLHAEGLRLRVVGELWETLVSTVSALSRGLREVRTSLVYFSGLDGSLDAIADLRGIGVALPVDGILRDIATGLRKLQPQPAAHWPQQPQFLGASACHPALSNGGACNQAALGSGACQLAGVAPGCFNVPGASRDPQGQPRLSPPPPSPFTAQGVGNYRVPPDGWVGQNSPPTFWVCEEDMARHRAEHKASQQSTAHPQSHPQQSTAPPQQHAPPQPHPQQPYLPHPPAPPHALQQAAAGCQAGWGVAPPPAARSRPASSTDSEPSLPVATRLATAPEPTCNVGLHGMPMRSASGWRLRVYYDQGEEGVVSYDATSEAVDPVRGLKVKLDGYKAREHLTDDDEWEWLDGAGGANGPWPVERVFGAALRGYLSKLGALADKLGDLPGTAEPPPAGKPGKRAAANGAAGDKAGTKKAAKGGEAKVGAEAKVGVKRLSRDGEAGRAVERAMKAAGKGATPDAVLSIPVELVWTGEPAPSAESGGGKRRKQ